MKCLAQEHFQHHLLDEETEVTPRQKGFGKAASTLLLRLDMWSHLLFIPMESLLVIVCFLQRLGQNVGTPHSQRCSLP